MEAKEDLITISKAFLVFILLTQLNEMNEK